MSNPRSRKPVPISYSFHQQLAAYALTASAAGVGIGAMSQPAEGRVVYTPTKINILPPHGSYQIDLNHDGIADFTLLNSTYGSDIEFNDLGLKNSSGDNGVIGFNTSGGWRFASALKVGARIGNGGRFQTRNEGWLLVSSGFSGYTTSPLGPWLNVKDRYLGLRFTIKGQSHYGWARLTVTRQNRKIMALLTGYAYETIPNKSIIAGKTKGSDTVAQRGTLGQLAIGRK